ncbi:MAG: hypothetical protein HN348_14630 [Proteobacteria bacterium]|jgi:hypothetical protein|nr:hypothetical protein [Pseudomonadota bacterium]
MKNSHALLARRIPRTEVVVGRVYIIHGRNGGVGVAVEDEAGFLGYRLHREKFGRHYLFTEIDWEDDDFYGTAIPLRLLSDIPPADEDSLLAWLVEREAEHSDEIKAGWREVLGDIVDLDGGVQEYSAPVAVSLGSRSDY